MKISLITSTLNRPRQITELLASLEQQSRAPDQIIIVDQSDDVLTQQAVESFQDRLPLLYLRDQRKGLSRGRNLGLQYLAGDVVAFPDDDCVYAPDTVAIVMSEFEALPGLDIFTGMSISPSGAPSQGRWGKVPHTIDKFNIWISQTSYTTFYRSKIVKDVGGFDESLGVGSGTKWGAGEETEMMLRALAKGAFGRYDPSLKVTHPEPLAIFDSAALRRGQLYNRGFGRVLNLGKYPSWFVAYMAARPLSGALAALVRGRMGQAKYRFVAGRERLLGWRDRRESVG